MESSGWHEEQGLPGKMAATEAQAEAAHQGQRPPKDLLGSLSLLGSKALHVSESATAEWGSGLPGPCLATRKRRTEGSPSQALRVPHRFLQTLSPFQQGLHACLLSPIASSPPTVLWSALVTSDCHTAVTVCWGRGVLEGQTWLGGWRESPSTEDTRGWGF